MKLELRAQFTLFGQIERDGDWFIAHCPPLEISTQGRTITEAKKNLREASELFLISCFERGTLDQALKELGFVSVKVDHQVKLNKNCFKMDVPVPFGLEKSVPCHA